MTHLFWRGRAVAVLGGAGFIGSNLTIRLAELGASVTVVDGLVPGCGGHPSNLAPVAGGITFVRADLSTDPIPGAILDADIVFDLMGDPAHGRSISDPARDLRHNLVAQLRTFEEIRRSAHRPFLVLVSSRSVYGRPTTLPVTEAHSIAPPDPNAIHKYAAEQYAVLYGRLYDLAVVRLRLTNVYGARQPNREAAHGVTGYLLGRLLRGEPVLLYGGGRFLRDWLAVDDAVAALLEAGSRRATAGLVLNIGHCDPCTLRDFASLARELLGRGELTEVPFPQSQQSIDVGDYWTDPTRAAEQLGWRAATPLRQGLTHALDFYLATPQGSQWPPATSPSST